MDRDGHIYTTSLTVLLSTRPTDTPSTKQTWRRPNTAPLTWSTLSTIGLLVVVVGGVTGRERTGDVHGLVGDGWTRVGRMNTTTCMAVDYCPLTSDNTFSHCMLSPHFHLPPFFCEPKVKRSRHKSAGGVFVFSCHRNTDRNIIFTFMEMCLIINFITNK